jgi:hypothetical protein
VSNSINHNDVDDKELDEYLSGGTQYSQRYRATPADAVPGALDHLVLAHASATNVTPIAVAADKRSSVRRKPLAFWIRVGAPVAIAASFVFAISIMLNSGVRYDSAPSFNQATSAQADKASATEKRLAERGQSAAKADVAQDAYRASKAKETTRRDITLEETITPPSPVQAQVPAEPVNAQPPPAKVSEAKTAELKNESVASAVGVLSTAAAPAASPPPEARATTQLEQVVVTGQARRSLAEDAGVPVDVISAEDLNRLPTGANAGPRDTIPPASFAKKQNTDEELAKRREADPTAWLAHIRELRATGKARAADAEWKRFVAAYPTYSVDAADTARPKK